MNFFGTCLGLGFVRFKLLFVPTLFFVQLALGQSVEFEQASAVNSIPGLKVHVLEQAVRRGDKPSGATTKYGDPSTVTHSKTFTGTPTTSTNWPEAGVYKEYEIKILGSFYDTSEESPFSPERHHSMYDGVKQYRYLEGSGRTQVHAEKSRNGSYESPIAIVFQLKGLKPFEFEKTEVDPKWGKVRILKDGEQVARVVEDRDFMATLIQLGGGIEYEVLKMDQIGGHWMPTELVERGIGMTRDIDVYRTFNYTRDDSLTAKNFPPPLTKGTLWIENDIYYDVIGGKLVKSKHQPDRTSEYLSWVAMGVAALTVFGFAGYTCHKLFGKSSGPVKRSKAS